MSDPNIPIVPNSFTPDQNLFAQAVKACLEILMGQGRNLDKNRALRVYEYDAGIATIQEQIPEPQEGESLDTPEPPTNLQVIKGLWSHHLTWDNPIDEIVSHIEIWVAVDSQNRSNARLRGVVTVTDNLRGEGGNFDYSDLSVTSDLTYWIRSVSYAGNHSTWEPPDDQGGYVVPGSETIQEAIDKIMDALHGSITENELYQDLNTRIDLIDNPGTGLIDRLAGLETAVDSIPTFDAGLAYFVDDIVSYSNKIYACVKNTTVPSHPPTDTEYWKLIGSSASLAGEVAANALEINKHNTRIVNTEEGIESLSNSYSLLHSNVNKNTASIQNEEEARTTEDEALAQQIITLFTETGDNSAAIQSEKTARTTADSALAQQINTVQSTVGNHTTSIQTNATSIDGVKGKYSVKIDNNGYITGYGLLSTNNNSTPTSEFIMLVDKFKIVSPGITPQIPFAVGRVGGTWTVGINGNLVVDGTILARHIKSKEITADKIATGTLTADKIAAKTITADKIAAGTITAASGILANASVTNAKIANLAVNTLKIANQAVTIPVSAYTKAELVGIEHQDNIAQSATIISTGAPIFITFSMRLDAHIRYFYYLNRGAESIYVGYSSEINDLTLTIAIQDTPGIGKVTYTATFYPLDTGLSVMYRSLTLLEVKR